MTCILCLPVSVEMRVCGGWVSTQAARRQDEEGQKASLKMAVWRSTTPQKGIVQALPIGMALASMNKATRCTLFLLPAPPGFAAREQWKQTTAAQEVKRIIMPPRAIASLIPPSPPSSFKGQARNSQVLSNKRRPFCRLSLSFVFLLFVVTRNLFFLATLLFISLLDVWYAPTAASSHTPHCHHHHHSLLSSSFRVRIQKHAPELSILSQRLKTTRQAPLKRGVSCLLHPRMLLSL